MNAHYFICTRDIRSREVLEIVLKNEIAKIEERHTQYDTLCASAETMERAGRNATARACREAASEVLGDVSLLQSMYAYVLTGEVAGLSRETIDAIEALPYLKNR